MKHVMVTVLVGAGASTYVSSKESAKCIHKWNRHIDRLYGKQWSIVLHELKYKMSLELIDTFELVVHVYSLSVNTTCNSTTWKLYENYTHTENSNFNNRLKYILSYYYNFLHYNKYNTIHIQCLLQEVLLLFSPSPVGQYKLYPSHTL